ncbi:Glycine betaine/L-proline transport ATP-binding protein ProV [Roseovarius sp. THAF27]|uniref:quaternary amine ABC transporter ATP-binding protein n=1 Tax=unclassified Roseovarius TaxID=2614913 RepID=UPI001267D4F1|nr:MULTISPECIES: betaine/proline/choline family ABC transporter ATP-binding protein [unclassified Roseovarius]QFT81795.1 Glycine betaine/L-proline transport ATP-binding protein ProV [Roseovarius sp. THAF27]QFT99064.1 Glycine betaine/L-proline transport ATP-binding protein ProV [Roseovarius sp. THAF8]
MSDTQESDGAGTDQPRLSCRHIWKVYGKKPEQYFPGGEPAEKTPALAERIREDGAIPAAADVSFDVAVGEIFVIMGLSGSGKSTVVRCLSRLVEPTHGEILLDGEDLRAKSDKEMIEVRRHQIGMVFQNFGLMPHLSVWENIAFPLSLQGAAQDHTRERVGKVIELVGLEGREKSYPHQLSGGQQQRVGIARSLAVDPDLWLLDEPFSALDPLIRRQMQDEFLRIQNDLQKSIVFITHDFLEALRVADRMMIMRGGRVVQTGTPAELITNPADDYVAEFTNDVPMVRVLRAHEVTDPEAGSAEGRERVSGDVSVEALLPMLSAHPEGLAVEQGGTVTGVVTAQSVVRALARLSEQEEAPA